jgi:anti-sigma factor RsiW
VNCTEAETFVHAYVDGELMGQDREAYERHLGTCERCRVAGRFEGRFKAAIRAHLPRPSVPAALERRLEVALASMPSRPGRHPWATTRRWVPVLAVAAGVVVVVAGTVKQRHSFVWEQARRTYQKELPLDVVGSDCRSVASWFRGRVDFPVHAPELPDQFNCLGGRLVNVEDQLAAYLVYQDPHGDRVAVLVFDPASVPIEAAHRRVVNGREIYYQSDPGTSTAGYKDRDIVHLVTSGRKMEDHIRLVSLSH